MTDLTIPAPLWRRFAAAFYDVFLLLAIWVIVAFLDALLRNVTGGNHNPYWMRIWLFLSGFLFFGWFWTHGGQTLGMRAWRLQLRRTDRGPLHWPQTLWRYALAWLAWAPLGLGVLWCAIDSRRQAAHDRIAKTEVVLLPKA